MHKSLTVLLSCLIAQLLFTVIAFADDNEPVIREEQKIVINGIEETWRLEWASTPKSVCGPENDPWSSAACGGFTYGEGGDLSLVRIRPGHEEERLSLNPLFADWFYSSTPPEATLVRWEEKPNDSRISNRAGFAEQVRSRPDVRIMNFKDYDHDGRSTEFLLHVATEPRGSQYGVVVGVSRNNPQLHVFSGVKKQKDPLILQLRLWESLRKAKGLIKVTSSHCGENGFDGAIEYELKAQHGAIYATRFTYDCTWNKKKVTKKLAQKSSL